jgi:hypothetical protein
MGLQYVHYSNRSYRRSGARQEERHKGSSANVFFAGSGYLEIKEVYRNGLLLRGRIKHIFPEVDNCRTAADPAP